jgi:hypothetical protein
MSTPSVAQNISTGDTEQQPSAPSRDVRNGWIYFIYDIDIYDRQARKEAGYVIFKHWLSKCQPPINDSGFMSLSETLPNVSVL